MSGADSARVWVASKSGVISITGNVNVVGGQGADGVIVQICKNNYVNKIIGPTLISAGNSLPVAMNALNVSVEAGDSIYFIVNQNTNNSYDTTFWNPTVVYSMPVFFSASSGFSVKQGKNQWSFMRWNGTSMTYMDYDIANERWGMPGSFCFAGNNWQHPDAVADSVRMWMAPRDGTVNISGTIMLGQVNKGGDGISYSVKKNGDNLIYSTSLIAGSKSGNDASLTQLNYNNLTVKEGDTIYFTLNMNGNSGYDSTMWDPVITYIR